VHTRALPTQRTGQHFAGHSLRFSCGDCGHATNLHLSPGEIQQLKDEETHKTGSRSRTQLRPRVPDDQRALSTSVIPHFPNRHTAQFVHPQSVHPNRRKSDDRATHPLIQQPPQPKFVSLTNWKCTHTYRPRICKKRRVTLANISKRRATRSASLEHGNRERFFLNATSRGFTAFHSKDDGGITMVRNISAVEPGRTWNAE